MSQDKKRRSFWLKQLHRWHWISAALCLVGMLLFAATGITLNNASLFETGSESVTRNATLPDALLADIRSRKNPEHGPPGRALADWIKQEFKIDAETIEAEWSRDEIYLPLPRPGGDAWLSIDLADGKAQYESADRGWIAYLNDLHKGRHTGAVWSWFIDIFAGGCLVFCVTGLFLLKLHSSNRPSTWPTVGLGLVVPLLLALLFIH